MPQFRYRAVTHAGEIVVGEVDASSCEEVVRRIEYLGHLTIDAEIAATGILNRGRGSIGKLPRSRDVSIFLRQLALLIGAGLTLDAALQTLGDDASKSLAGVAGGLCASISAGESLVRFHPDGASTGAALKLSREKAEYEIRVNWCTGGVAIAP